MIGLNKAEFAEKKVYFNEHWNDIVTSTEGCISIIDDDFDDNDKEEQLSELSYQIEVLKSQFKQFIDLEIETERKTSDIEKKMLPFQNLSTCKRSRS